MLELPPVAPATGWRAALRLPRDHYVRLDANDDSVAPSVIGRRVEGARTWTACRCLRRTPGGRPRALLGQTPDDHRS
jgi:hypothetical protein